MCETQRRPYRSPLSVTDALAQSPNTAFAKLISQIGVPRAVDMAVRLGLRSYAEPGSAHAYNPDSDESIADYVKRQNIGSFTLGPLELNALELSNVGATLASGGTWCPPNPIDKSSTAAAVKCRGDGPLRTSGTRGPCQHAGQRARQGPHERNRCRRSEFGRLDAADVGQDRYDRVSPVVGIPWVHQPVRRSELHLRRFLLTVGSLLVPVAQMRDGDLYGGTEPALTWYRR